jgi:hypothetical protein
VLKQLTEAGRSAFSSPIDLPWIDALRQSSKGNEARAAELLNAASKPNQVLMVIGGAQRHESHAAPLRTRRGTIDTRVMQSH